MNKNILLNGLLWLGLIIGGITLFFVMYYMLSYHTTVTSLFLLILVIVGASFILGVQKPIIKEKDIQKP